MGSLPPSDPPRVALTFDDGPHPRTTGAVLDRLRAHGVVATFFVVGEECRRHEAVLRDLIEAGMSVGVHGWSHADLTGREPAFVHDELRRCVDLLGELGAAPTLFRPPYGRWDRQLDRIVAAEGLRTVLWNVDPRDWERPGADVIAQHVIEHARDGSIVVLHDGGRDGADTDRTQTVQALPRMIDGLRARGFRLAGLARDAR